MKKSSLSNIRELETHREKIFWPKEKITKGDLLDYYEAISPLLLPFLKNRPISMIRYPDGITGNKFFQKQAPEHIPEWIEKVSVEHPNKNIDYILIQDLPSLIYTVNLGAIEIHPFLSTYPDINFPDLLALDLDPEDLSFDSVIEVALTAHELLQGLKINHYCKTSGKRGMHIFVPLKDKYEYEQVTQFAELLAFLIHKVAPEITSLERMPEKRQKKVYIDFLQNGRTKTVIAPYCVRAIEGAPVSTPLDWNEVKPGVDPREFNIITVPKRMKKKKNWVDSLFKNGNDLGVSLKLLEKKL